QVQNRFVSSADVSRELNLLRQSETDVRYGNLLTLPVGGGLLYVEPVYIERANQQAAFPQLNRVLVAYGDRIGYAPTLREALNQVFGAGAGDATASPGQQATAGNQGATQPPASAGSGAASQNMRQAVADIADALKRLRAAQAAGDFSAQGKALADLDAATKRFDTASGAAGAATPAPVGGGG
ncbi:MAG: membrane protein, partial [Pseudonocardiaceae bacterium]